MLATEVIRCKRDRGTLSAEQVTAFARGLASGEWTDAQCGALAMAICLNGMSRAETVPVRSKSRSLSVVFPWSMWAMMEKLRICD